MYFCNIPVILNVLVASVSGVSGIFCYLPTPPYLEFEYNGSVNFLWENIKLYQGLNSNALFNKVLLYFLLNTSYCESFVQLLIKLFMTISHFYV